MSIRKYLDDAIKDYYSKLFEKNNFKLTETVNYENYAANNYKGDFYILKVGCDRGIIEGEIAAIYNSETFIYITDLYIHVKLLQLGDEKPNAWDLRMITSKVLSSEEQIEFLDKEHELIIGLLNEENHKKTFQSIHNSVHKKYTYPKYEEQTNNIEKPNKKPWWKFW